MFLAPSLQPQLVLAHLCKITDDPVLLPSLPLQSREWGLGSEQPRPGWLDSSLLSALPSWGQRARALVSSGTGAEALIWVTTARPSHTIAREEAECPAAPWCGGRNTTTLSCRWPGTFRASLGFQFLLLWNVRQITST